MFWPNTGVFKPAIKTAETNTGVLDTEQHVGATIFPKNRFFSEATLSEIGFDS